MFGAISKFMDDVVRATRIEKGYNDFSTKLATCIQFLNPMVSAWSSDSIFVPAEEPETFNAGGLEYTTFDIGKTHLQIAARYLENTERISTRMGKYVEELKKNVRSKETLEKIRNCVDEMQNNFSSLSSTFWQLQAVSDGAIDKTMSKFAQDCNDQVSSMVVTLLKMRIGAKSERGLIWN